MFCAPCVNPVNDNNSVTTMMRNAAVMAVMQLIL